MIKPLDFVKTPRGATAIVTEVNVRGMVSITFVGNTEGWEKNAWWEQRELEVIDSLPHLLARQMCHPFGDGRQAAESAFGLGEA